MGKTVFSSFLNGLMVHEMSDFLASWLVQCTISKMCFPLFSLSIFYNGQWMVQKASDPKYIF